MRRAGKIDKWVRRGRLLGATLHDFSDQDDVGCPARVLRHHAAIKPCEAAFQYWRPCFAGFNMLARGCELVLCRALHASKDPEGALLIQREYVYAESS